MTRTLPCFLRACTLALSLFLLGAVGALAQIPAGATKEEVIKLLGWPISSSGNENRELLNYEECNVLLEHGKLVKLEFKSPESRQDLFRKLGQSDGVILPEAEAKPAATEPANPAPAAPKAPAAKPLPPEPTRSSWGILKTSLLVGAVVIILAFMAYKSWASEKKDFVKLQRDLLKQGNTQSEAPYKPAVRDPSSLVRSSDPFVPGVTLSLLREMEWHQFELLVAAFERELGYDARPTQVGSDDGVDIRIVDRDPGHVTRLIECKAHGHPVKPELVTALAEVMAAEKVPAGTFYAPNGFTPEAMTLAQKRNVELIDGAKLVSRIKLLDARAQARLLAVAKEGDYKTPTCPKCGTKMKLVDDKTPAAHWACGNAPRCDATLKKLPA